MKINILLLIAAFSLIFMAFSGYYRNGDLIGCTELNGNGCVCHNLEPSQDVSVWVEGPDTLLRGQTGIYRMHLTGGPAIAGGYNVAVRYGVLSAVDSLSYWDYRVPFELTQAFPLPFANISDTIFWNFAFTASGDTDIDTIYSCGLSTNWDTIPDYRDLWAFGAKHPVTIIPEVPVQLVAFDAIASNGSVILTWKTASETNNSGFHLQKLTENNNWMDLAFIQGKGNFIGISEYEYLDEMPKNGINYYRLKQSDYNGSYTYSAIKSAAIPLEGFALEQNYPNPFNPVTTIRYTLPFGEELTSLKIYDVLGNEVKELVNKKQASGSYEIKFDGSKLAAGVYFYTLTKGKVAQTRKLVLIK